MLHLMFFCTFVISIQQKPSCLLQVHKVFLPELLPEKVFQFLCQIAI